jgi:CheY-like chemotaxis protein
MRVESETSHGATFIVELPVTTDVLSPGPEESVQTPKNQPASTRKVRILVVDDEPSVREFMQNALTLNGHSVDTTGDPKEVLARLANTAYDVLFFDIRMPQMSGIELYSNILEKTPKLAKRIIFMTGDVMGADIKAFLSQNKLPYLAKPFNLESLREKLNTVLKNDQSKIE